MQSTTIVIFLQLILIVSLNGHSLPITRHQSSLKQQATCGTVGPNNNTILGFGNCFNNIYYINIEIGTPGQTLGVQFDTGSNTLWVPTQQTGMTNAFQTSQSSTFTNTSQTGGVKYVDGSGVSGTYGTDVFTIQNSLISIVTTYLWVTSDTLNYPQQIQGLVGMGYTTTPNFLDVAYSQNLIATSAFALQILDQTAQSLIYYNQIPQKITNSTYYVPVSSDYYWGATVYAVSVGGIDMTDYAADLAVIDSGTSYFYLNPSLFQNVVNTFFSDCINVGGIPHCPCSSTPNWPVFTISLEGVQVQIQPVAYTASITTNVCTYQFGSIGGQQAQLLIGDIFFRSYIVTFDKLNSQIGFSGDTLVTLPVLSNKVNDILGWILMGIMGAIVFFGLIVSCCLQSGLNNAYGMTGVGVRYPQMQLTGNTARLRDPIYV